MTITIHPIGTDDIITNSEQQPQLFSTCTILKTSTGRMIIVNCSEGTQTYFMKHGHNFNRVDIILITRLNYSHLSGLPGMMAMLLYKKREENPHVTIVGPPGIQSYCETIFNLTDTFFRKLPMTYIEVSHQGHHVNLTNLSMLSGDKLTLQVSACLLTDMSSCCYLLCAQSQSGLDQEKLKMYGVMDGSMKKMLSSRQIVTTQNDQQITYDMVKATPRLDKLIYIIPSTFSSTDHCTLFNELERSVLNLYSNTSDQQKPKQYSKIYLIEDELKYSKYDHNSRTNYLTQTYNDSISFIQSPSLVIHVQWLPNGMGTLLGNHQIITVDNTTICIEQNTEKIQKMKEKQWNTTGKSSVVHVQPVKSDVAISV